MSATDVVIVDYGLGNLFNVRRAFEFLRARVTISCKKNEILDAPRVVLPGVGAFGAGMDNLKQAGLTEVLRDFASTGKPFLGICLGMQLLMAESVEHGAHEGLKLIEGSVLRFKDAKAGEPSYKIPQTGWNILELDPESAQRSCLKGFEEAPQMYFVHSYYVAPKDERAVVARTPYGGLKFCSVLKKDNVQGCQFHPERSGPVGLKLLENFLRT